MWVLWRTSLLLLTATAFIQVTRLLALMVDHHDDHRDDDDIALPDQDISLSAVIE